jgi:hypothetical protein
MTAPVPLDDLHAATNQLLTAAWTLVAWVSDDDIVLATGADIPAEHDADQAVLAVHEAAAKIHAARLILAGQMDLLQATGAVAPIMRCGTCFWFKRTTGDTGPVNGICNALVGRSDVPEWARLASIAYRHESDDCGCWLST